jgi:hypothetical protein
MRFYAGYGIHGTNNSSSIGGAVSHGCVRMYNHDVIDLYNKVSYGTLVHITGTAKRARALGLGISPGPDILELQETLRRLGFYYGPSDGYFNSNTGRSVAAFQERAQLITDGIVGPQTQAALQKYHDIIFNDIEP